MSVVDSCFLVLAVEINLPCPLDCMTCVFAHSGLHRKFCLRKISYSTHTKNSSLRGILWFVAIRLPVCSAETGLNLRNSLTGDWPRRNRYLKLVALPGITHVKTAQE